MEGNVSVYQVNPVSRISGEGRAGFKGVWGHGFEQERAGGGEGRAGQLKIMGGAITAAKHRHEVHVTGARTT